MERGKNKAEWRELATTRLRDAEVLFANERYAAAYYLAGYAVECALKARIASFMREGDFPPKPEEVRKRFYTHNLADLGRAAELQAILEAGSIEADWAIATKWNEESRYESRDRERAAKEMLVSARGVVECIKQYW